LYKNYQFYLAQLYRFADLIALNVACFVFIFFIAEELGTILQNVVSVFAFINIVWLLISDYFKIYNLGAAKSKNRYYFSIGLVIFFTFSGSLFVDNLINIIPAERPILFLIDFYLLFSVLLLLFRWVTTKGYKLQLKRKNKKLAIVVVGKGIDQRELTKYFNQNVDTEFQKVISIHETENLRSKLTELQKTETITQLYIPLSRFDQRNINLIGKYCDNNFIRLRLVFDMSGLSSQKMYIKQFNETTVFNIASTPLDDPYNALLKRLFDILFSVTFFLLFFWIFPLIAIVVKLSSKGPVFFKQMRSGLNNREFACYKFRSMRQNVEADKRQATQNDPRITKVEAFLRRTSLDELPQFYNVLIGNMSVVGPRPHMLKHTEEYKRIIGDFMERHAIKPGITGLAQVKGYRGEIQNISLLKNRVRFDRFYVYNWTIFFDFKIVLRTIGGIFKDHL